MILSVSRRTDIPAFYADWFMNRLREGYLIVNHHPSSGVLYRVPTNPDVVDCIVFRTKNPAPMLEHLPALGDYRYLFNITMNPYGREMESNLPGLQERIDTFRRLSAIVGPLRMIWRYDPIMLSHKYDMDFHRRSFEFLCRELQGLSYKCMIGFIIHHPFVAKRLDPLFVKRRQTRDVLAVGDMFGRIAARYGQRVETCATNIDLDEYGIGHGACIDRVQIERIVGQRFARVREGYLRPHCRCMESVDVGHYSTCNNGCLYCYATPGLTQMNFNPLSESLDPGFDAAKVPPERIVDMKCHSFRAGQMSLW